MNCVKITYRGPGEAITPETPVLMNKLNLILNYELCKDHLQGSGRGHHSRDPCFNEQIKPNIKLLTV